jgi:hypothetical protein
MRTLFSPARHATNGATSRRFRYALLPAIFLWVGSAQAASLSFSPLDLARGELYLQGDELEELEDAEAATLTIPGVPGSCTVAYSGGAIYSNGPGTCPGLWAMVDLKAFKATLKVGDSAVTVDFTPNVQAQTKAFSLSGEQVVIPAGVPPLSEVAILRWGGDASSPKPSGWEVVTVEGGKIALGQPTATVAQKAGGRFLVIGFDANAEEFQPLSWQVLAANSATPAPVANPVTPPLRPAPTGSSTIAPTSAEPEGVAVDVEAAFNDISGFSLQALGPGDPIPPELACPPSKLPQEDMTVVCVDATGPVMRYWQSPTARFTKPNRPFYVHVVHRAEHRAALVMGGTIGSYAPGSRGRFVLSGAPGEGFNLEGDGQRPVTYYVTARNFAPRKPGFAPLEVRLLDAQNQLVADPLKIEFWIEATYSGAFRVGVAGILMGSLDEHYRAETRPGSQQREIVQQGSSVMDLDVVIGYSPYLDAGGRSASGCESAPFCFNPYFGLGLLSASSGGDLQWLKSVHLGVEWELTEAFAVGLTANLRRVERLARGFSPGYPIDGEVPTDDKFVFGVGLVINLSPEFLKVGASGAAAVLK